MEKLQFCPNGSIRVHNGHKTTNIPPENVRKSIKLTEVGWLEYFQQIKNTHKNELVPPVD